MPCGTTMKKIEKSLHKAHHEWSKEKVKSVAGATMKARGLF